MTTVYLGTSEFGAAVLRRLAASPYRPALVVTPPDRPRGRGRRVAPPPVAGAAAELGLALHQTESVNRPESVAAIQERRPDLGLVCAFGQLIKEPLLNEPEMLNVHPSLLPRWRGAAPIERAIIAGDDRTGVSVMKLTEGLDSGPVALVEETTIEPGETFGELWPRLAEIGGELLVRALELRDRGELGLTPQDDSTATYAEKIERSERHLDPAADAGELVRVVWALTPHVGAYLELAGGGRLGVRAAEPLDSGPATGEIDVSGDALALVLGCGSGAVRITRVQPPGGREMSASDYIRGHEPPVRAV